jgi:uncharacterized protein YqjF (DUF2071 family)
MFGIRSAVLAVSVILKMVPSLDERLAARERPNLPVVMTQDWNHLLFLHWEVDPAVIQATLPRGLKVDMFEERGFLGVVPFFMDRVRPRFCPCVPGVSCFLELNLRTYVFDERGRPGVWFYSLDCNQWLAVKVARGLFRLPYEHARMSASCADGEVVYSSERLGDDVRQEYRYPAEVDGGEMAVPGSVEFFLLERYRLFSVGKGGRIFSGLVNHLPYRFRQAEIADYSTRTFSLAGFDEPKTAPVSSLVAESVSVNIFPLKKN